MANEQYGFVFAITFIIVFATFLIATPTDLQGVGETPDTLAPVDPSLIAGFDDAENYTGEAGVFTGYPTKSYAYSVGDFDWIVSNLATTFMLGAKVYYFGFLWIGVMSYVNFINPDGVNQGTVISFDYIDADAIDGEIRYNLIFSDTGNDAGALVIYWNSTLYSSSLDAWNADELYFVHGTGFSATATNNIGALLVGLLFLSLPQVPTLIQVLLVTPLWSSIIYVLWYVIKEMIPFV